MKNNNIFNSFCIVVGFCFMLTVLIVAPVAAVVFLIEEAWVKMFIASFIALWGFAYLVSEWADAQ